MLPITEQENPNTAAIDKVSTIDAVKLINAEDKTVGSAVEMVLPEVAAAIFDESAVGDLQLEPLHVPVFGNHFAQVEHLHVEAGRITRALHERAARRVGRPAVGVQHRVPALGQLPAEMHLKRMPGVFVDEDSQDVRIPSAIPVTPE